MSPSPDPLAELFSSINGAPDNITLGSTNEQAADGKCYEIYEIPTTSLPGDKIATDVYPLQDSAEFKLRVTLGEYENFKEPGNHCLPVFQRPRSRYNPDEQSLLVPSLRPFDPLRVESEWGVVFFAYQVLEGMIYLHERGLPLGDVFLHEIRKDGQDHRYKGLLDSLGIALAPADHVFYYFAGFGHRGRTLGDVGYDPGHSDTECQDGLSCPFVQNVRALTEYLDNKFIRPYESVSQLRPFIAAIKKEAPHAKAALEWLESGAKIDFSQPFGRVQRAVYNLSAGEWVVLVTESE